MYTYSATAHYLFYNCKAHTLKGIKSETIFRKQIEKHIIEFCAWNLPFFIATLLCKQTTLFASVIRFVTYEVGKCAKMITRTKNLRWVTKYCNFRFDWKERVRNLQKCCLTLPNLACQTNNTIFLSLFPLQVFMKVVVVMFLECHYKLGYLFTFLRISQPFYSAWLNVNFSIYFTMERNQMLSITV